MHTGSTALAIELNALKIEHERLLEQSSHADAAIYELTMEREDYKMRWLGSMTTRDAQLIRDENERLRAALREIREKGCTTGYGRAALATIARRALASNDEQAADGKL